MSEDTGLRRIWPVTDWREMKLSTFTTSPFPLPLLLLLTVVSQPAGSAAKGACALYDPPTPGLHCFHGEQLLQALRRSEWAWMVELYSSWCGHCQNFAPRLKELAEEVEPWGGMVRIAVLECTESKENQEICSKLQVQAYPTIRFFKPFDSNPLEFKKTSVGGGKNNLSLRRMIVDHVTSVEPYPTHWPDFDPLLEGGILEEEVAGWMPSLLIFEENDPYLGKEMILDYSGVENLRVKRVSQFNAALVHHYSILEFPSAVLELSRGHYDIIPGHSAKDARSEFRQKIAGHLQGVGSRGHVAMAPSLSPSPPPVPAPVERGRSRDGSIGREQHHAPQHHAGRGSHGNKPHPQRNRVDLSDLLNAISYALRNEVTIHSIISGPTYSSLLNFLSLLEQGFTGVSPRGVAASLRDVRVKLEGRSHAGFVTNKEWQRIIDSKLNEELFPPAVSWRMCNGSQPHLRGYPCALWLLMHTLTIRTLPLNHTHPAEPHPPTITSTEAVSILTKFIGNFFSCEVCRQHFLKMAATLSRQPLGSHGDAIMWLWEAHNLVNARLSTAGGSGDPLHPKQLFPLINRCPYCYLTTVPEDAGNSRMPSPPHFNNTHFARGESLVVGVAGGVDSRFKRSTARSMLLARPLDAGGVVSGGAVGSVYMWNRTAVLLYLWNFYHLGQHGNGTRNGMERRHHAPRPPSSAILQAAWPAQTFNDHNNQRRHHDGRMEWRHDDDDSVESEVCMLPFLACICGMALTLFLLFRWRRKRWRLISWTTLFNRGKSKSMV